MAALGAAYVVMIDFPVQYIHVVGEDRFGEYATAAAYAASSVLFFFGALKSRGMIRVSGFVLAAICYLIGGEEVSWGQRILHVRTPEFLMEINHQGETTIHNIGALQYTPFHMIAGIGMLVLALAALFPRLLGPLANLGPVPSRPLWMVFVIASAVLILRPMPKGDEVAELLLSLAILGWSADLFATVYRRRDTGIFIGALALVALVSAGLDMRFSRQDVWRYTTLALRDYPAAGLYAQSHEILDYLEAQGLTESDLDAEREELRLAAMHNAD